MRHEEDNLGSMTLPSDCLYGVRTARCVENMSFSGSRLSQYPHLIIALAQVKKACAQANGEAKTISQNIAELICSQCDRIIDGQFNDHFPVDMLHGGGYIGFNSNINEVLANMANLTAGSQPGSYTPVDPKRDVNCGQSTADVCHTAVRLAIVKTYANLDIVLLQLIASFRRLQQQFNSVQTTARTCLQDAMPVALGESFGAYAAFAERRHNELRRAVETLHAINLGGTVIGSGDGANPHYQAIVIEKLAAITYLPLRLRANLFDAAQNIDDLVSVSAQLRMLAEGLIKIAKDIRLLGSGPNCGFAEIILPAVQEGSSFFPGKINPVVPETLIQAGMQIIGCDRAASAALEHAELNLNIFEGVAAKNILDSIRMLQEACCLFDMKCLNGMQSHDENCRRYANSVQQAVKV